MRRRHQPARDIVLRIVAGRHFLRLAQRALARAHVVVEDLRRRRHRRIGEAHDVGVVFVGARQAERIGFLVEGDHVLLAGRAVADDDARQAVLALQPDEESLKPTDARGSAGRARAATSSSSCRDRVGDRRGHDLEVLGAVGIGQDEEDVAAFLKIVLQAGLARRDELRLGSGSSAGEEPVFRGLVVVDARS